MSLLVGIDLGTSNCAMACADASRGADAEVQDFLIPQLIQAGQVQSRSLLPSALYIPAAHEISSEFRLPWQEAGDPFVIGEFARRRGNEVPGRLVTSAKSWLCHSGVDRSAPILPWGAPPDLKKLSPVEVTALLLRHMRESWDNAHPESPLAEQEILITVPASFDEVARALTVTAARQAGIEKFTLLEEPQAAFYDFTSRHRHVLPQALNGVHLVLVVDIGGGTTDFTLIQVSAGDQAALRRIAVGEHLMLGGDNMDIALARRVEQQIAANRKLSTAQWLQLVQATRTAKETLLSEASPDSYRIGIASEGSQLLGRTVSATISRGDAEQAILDGFFPFCSPTDEPRRPSRTAIQELALPYAQDPAITRHLAAFLRGHATAGFAALGRDSGSEKDPPLPRPDAVLVNGGVFNAPQLRNRLLEALSAWWPDQPPLPLLQRESLELAVARGAAYYGLVRHGLGQRIGGGTARSLYIGLADQSSEGVPLTLCIVPRGQQEGQTVELTGRTFHLTLNQPVKFPLFSSSADDVHRTGEMVPLNENLQPLPPIHTILKTSRHQTAKIPVHLRVALTEIGTLELWCVANDTDEQWRLEFELRATAAEPALAVTETMPARFEEARALIESAFTGRGQPTGATASPDPVKQVKQLWTNLERLLGPRASWRVSLLRELWSSTFSLAQRRRRSSDHERIFFQLLGYSLRPGFGYPLDEWRCEQSFHLFHPGVQFQKEKPVWTEYWITWRRLAGGLAPQQQQEIWSFAKPHIAYRVAPHIPGHAPRPKGVQAESLEEMVRTAASLEHISPEEKAEFGDWILAHLQSPSVSSGGPWLWCIGRLGAREPVYGSTHNCVPPEKAAAWLEQLLQLDWRAAKAAPLAVAQLARLTGDRSRDLDDEIRTAAAAALRAAGSPENWLRMLEEIVALETSEEAQILGDTVPAGLELAPAKR